MTSPWLNETTRAKRRAWRQAERRWKKDRLQISLEMLRESQKAYHRAVKTERDNYFATLISNNTHNTRVLFRTINSVVHPPPTAIQDPSPVKCEEFLTFFSEKVETIRRNIPLSTRDLNISLGGPSTFTKFEPISLSFLTEIVSSLRSVSSPLDPIPAPLLKGVFNTLGPHILTIVNSSLVTGTVPSALKQAVVHPLIKKPSLDPTILSNYRPISKLPFLSKILEKAVLSQLSPYLTNNNILEKFQSGFRARHSTESALLKVLNDLLLIVDTGKCAALVLLDLSAAFDTVDHSILISRPQQGAGITNTALSWFKSYLSNRTYSVSLANFSSHQSTLTCGVPQGSILAPILFNLYMLPLSQIITRHNVSFHCYADDTQIYLPLTTDVPTSLTRLKTCLEDIKDWMAQNHLQLNESKGEIILFGTSTSVTQISTRLGTLSPLVKPTVKNLGVMFDSDLTFKPQVRAVVQSCFFQLRTIAKIKSFLSHSNLQTVILMFIFSRLDNCNALYSGLPDKTIQPLQLVQNAPARLLSGAKMRDHISPILRSLHWLPVKQRIIFKTLTFVYKAMNGLAPAYLSELLTRSSNSSWSLRSAERLSLKVPWTNKAKRGARAFAAIGPTEWNKLPFNIKSANTLQTFKARLKTHLFAQVG